MSNQRTKVALLVVSGMSMIGIALHEGYVGHSYKDVVGVNTIGFGTTVGVKPGQTITVERALIKLGSNVGEKEKAMKKCLGDVELYQYEWDAYVGLTYNIGTGAFCTSTLVKKLKHNPPDYNGACKEILKWSRAGKLKYANLERRKDEYRQCIGK